MKRLLATFFIIVMLGVACAPATLPTTPPASTSTSGPTDMPASTDTPAPTGTHIPVDLPPAQRAAMQALATMLGVPVDPIKLVSIEAVDWPNGCLGVVRIGVLCTDVIVPGFRIVLEANGTQYEYHTNADGSIVVLVTQGSDAHPDAPQMAAIQALAAALGVAESNIKVVSSMLVEWPNSCLGIAQPNVACLQVITPGYLIVLEVQGKQYEYHTNRKGSAVVPATLALTWHREGGVAGFCDDLTIYASGEAQASLCKTGGVFPTGVLTEAERDQLSQWLAKFGAVTVSMKDPAVADAMSISLTLSGTGAGQPTKAEEQTLLDWAQTVYTRLQGT